MDDTMNREVTAQIHIHPRLPAILNIAATINPPPPLPLATLADIRLVDRAAILVTEFMVVPADSTVIPAKVVIYQK